MNYDYGQRRLSNNRSYVVVKEIMEVTITNRCRKVNEDADLTRS